MAGPIVGSAALNTVQLNYFINKKVAPIIQKHKFFGALQKKGGVEFNCHSQEMEWNVIYRDRAVTWQNPGDVQVSPTVNRYKKAVLPWRSFYVSESMLKFDKLANRGPEARAKIWEDMIDSLSQAAAKDLGKSCFYDGNATGYTDKLHGLESCLGAGSVIGTSSVYAPNDTYAGLSTVLETYGGDADTFPIASDPQACFWSPLLLDPTGDDWVSGKSTWEDNWKRVLDFAHLYQDALRDGARPEVWFMDTASLSQAKASLEADEQIHVNRGKEPLVASLGYETVTYDGAELVAEYDIASGTAYGVNFSKMKLRSMQSQLFAKKESKDDTVDSSAVTLDFYGNLQIDSPAYLVKVYNFSG